MPLPRTFARVRAFDLACPTCGMLSAVHAHGKGYAQQDPLRRRGLRGHKGNRPHANNWSALTGVFVCRGCLRVYSIGVAIWRQPKGGKVQPPGDRVPTPAEAIGLRGIVMGERVGTGGRARGNLIVEGEVEDDPEIPARRTVAGDAFVGVREEDDLA